MKNCFNLSCETESKLYTRWNINFFYHASKIGSLRKQASNLHHGLDFCYSRNT